MQKDIKDHAEEVLAATFRAISHDKSANVSLKNSNQHDININGTDFSIPLNGKISPENIAYTRGMADSAALKLRYHNTTTHLKYKPESPEIAEIFDYTELTRIELLGSMQMQGVSHNICEKLAKNIEDKSFLDDIPTKEILSLLIRQAISADKLPENAHNLIKKWGGLLNVNTKRHVKSLKNNIDNQELFAREIIKILKMMSANSQDQEDTKHTPDQDTDENKQNEAAADNKSDDSNQQPIEQSTSFEEQFLGEENAATDTDEQDAKRKTSDYAPQFQPNYSEEGSEKCAPYHIYTREFDEVVSATDLCDKEELKHLRKQLDTRIGHLKNVKNKYINRFIRLLISQQNRNWNYNLEEGLIDNKKLSTIIANQNYTDYCKQEVESENSNTILTLLLDNSGSMRGRPISVAAMSAEIIAKTVEKFGIKVEILGFTTSEWRGGLSRKKWTQSDSPKKPGRLNDLRHIIYKAADVPLRKASKNMGAMLKEGILKENIDSEAILWACSRLAMRPEERRILMVISDGAPVDDSTISANSATYLDAHLRQVIHAIENQSEIEMVAIGIGHDVTRYYKKSVTIRDVDDLGDTMFQQLTDIFSE